MTEYYVYAASDEQGNESVVGIKPPGDDVPFMIPLTGRTREEMVQYRPLAEKLAQAMKTPVSLVRFTRREDVETIT
jgi:hypothetical protein